MTKSRTRRTTHATIAALACALAAALGAADADGGDIAPPLGTIPVAEVQAGGAQVYACQKSPAGAFAWALVGPKAILIAADGKDFGTHSAGPTWTAIDGSSIVADGAHPAMKVERTNSVPALLLRVTTSSGDGILAGVRFVRRDDTEGGLPPTDGCDAAHADATTASHYSAVYTFFR